ncbi:MAG: hypothetical protein H7Y12_11525 [Sphingobacteriaceae bacterium]|nr:hypothetical protein [Cytophagaceae bacterium]
MYRFQSYFFSSLLLLSLLTACKPTSSVEPDQNETPAPESAAPGFGTSKSRPEGTPFVFPAGISLVKKPSADADCWSETRKTKKIRGSGGAVAFCLTFSNTNAYPVRVELPPGLIWVAEESLIDQEFSQNGVLLKTVTVLVPAHAVETTWLVAYCLNHDRGITRTGDTFEAQPVLSSHPGLLDLARQLSTRKINEDEYPTEPTLAERQQLAFVQVAANDVQHYGTVQASTQRFLNELPHSK